MAFTQLEDCVNHSLITIGLPPLTPTSLRLNPFSGELQPGHSLALLKLRNGSHQLADEDPLWILIDHRQLDPRTVINGDPIVPELLEDDLRDNQVTGETVGGLHDDDLALLYIGGEESQPRTVEAVYGSGDTFVPVDGFEFKPIVIREFANGFLLAVEAGSFNLASGTDPYVCYGFFHVGK